MTFRDLNEYRYRKTVKWTGIGLLIFWGLIHLHAILYFFLAGTIGRRIASPVTAELISEIFYGAGYLFAFMFPVLFIRIGLRGADVPFQPVRAKFGASPLLPLILFGGISVVWVAAELNFRMVGMIGQIGMSVASPEFSLGEKRGYSLVLSFIVSCMVPAFCEEFLFRGTILSNFRPYGRSTSILISALLFAVMHANAEQIFYAFLAGIVLGFVYTETGNIWNCVFLHLFNNLFSLISAGGLTFGTPAQTLLFLHIAEGVLFALGSVSVAVLVCRISRKKKGYENGIFAGSVPAGGEYTPCALSPERSRKLFMSFPMVFFIALSAAETFFSLFIYD